MYSSYSVQDIYYYIIILMILGNNNEISFDELFNHFKDENSIDNELNTIKSRLNQLVDLGIIQKINNTYKLIPDLLNEVDDILNEMEYMRDITIFYYNHSFFSTAGYFLSKSINQYNIFAYNKVKSYFLITIIF